MSLINLRNISLSYDTARLFDEIDLTINQGERVALVGRNGSGKSTLLKLINRFFPPDSGTIAVQKGLRTAYLEQMVPGEMSGTAYEIVKSGIPPIHDTTVIQQESELHQRTEKTLSLLGLDANLVFNNLSAGLKRKVLLAKAFIAEPDLLLLDEPTNHMDIDSIKKLEEMLLRFSGAIILVTHDRSFLQRIARRIVEIDRGVLFDQSCDYETFLVRREAERENEKTRNALFDKKLKQEEEWVRMGIRARRTRNEGRVRELIKMRRVREERQARPEGIKITEQKTKRSGNLVVKAENVNFAYGETQIISNLNTVIMKGDKVGILGPNGSGKTTLLRLLLDELQPDSGSIRLGTNLQVNYFDQLREQLDENKTVQENIALENNDMVIINGEQRHIIGYLQDFLFSPEQIRSYVSTLSGGERNRLLLARLFTRPSNILILDEPTNDLDVETLEILEDYLVQYKGTVILVSHDRTFINNIVTSTLVFEDNESVNEYVGGYDDWQRQKLVEESLRKEPKIPQRTREQARIKFGFRQQKELDALPEMIQKLESEQEKLYKEMSDPDLYKTEDKSGIVTRTERLETVKKQLTDSYTRWEELEFMKSESTK